MDSDPQISHPNPTQSTVGLRDENRPLNHSIQPRDGPAGPFGPVPFRVSSSQQQPTGAPQTTRDQAIRIPSRSHSTTKSEDASERSHDAGDPLTDLKRPRACEGCRQLKVRCEFDSNNAGSCRRCTKAKRTCVTTAPNKRRQRKTDSRVAELEKKIDALTASLQSRQMEQRGGSLGMSFHEPKQEGTASRRWLGGAPPVPRPPVVGLSPNPVSKRTHEGDPKPTTNYGSDGLRRSSRSGSPTTPSGSTSGIPWSQLPFRNEEEEADTIFRIDGKPFDLIERGVIDAETATKAFNRFTERYAPIVPVVVFPPGTTMNTVRETKPILFHAIMAIVIGYFQPSLQTQLTSEVHRIFAEKIVIKGEKSLELIQALLVSCFWYQPPDNAEELKFFQFIYMAVAMAVEIGLCRRSRRPTGGMWGVLLKKGSLPDPDSVEARRTWLGCYLAAVNSSVALRRELLFRWNPYMDECVQILATSPDALPSDRTLVHWTKLCHILEDIGHQFAMDDPLSNVTLSDARMQFLLKGFERQLDQWRHMLTPEEYTPTIEHFEHIVNIFMHEIAIHTSHSDLIEFRPPYLNALADDKPPVDCASTIQVDALTACITSIHKSMDIIASFDPEDVICLPTIYFARLAYTSVVLLKLLSTISQSASLRKVIPPEELRVEQYLQKVITSLQEAGSIPGGRTAGKFFMILRILMNWFWTKHKVEDRPASRDEQSNVSIDSFPDNASASRAYCVDINKSAPQGDMDSSGNQTGPSAPQSQSTHDSTPSESRTHATQEEITQRDGSNGAQQWPGQQETSMLPTSNAESLSQIPQNLTFEQQPSQPPPHLQTQGPITTGYETAFPNLATAQDPQQRQLPYQPIIDPDTGMQMYVDPESLITLGSILHEDFMDMAAPFLDNMYPGSAGNWY